MIRRVREDPAEYVVTHQGRPGTIILPFDTERAEEEMVWAGRKAVLGNWERLEHLADCTSPGPLRDSG